LASQYLRDLVEDHRLYLPAGDGRVAWVDTRDIGEAAARLCVGAPPATGATYALTGGEALTLAETAATLSDAWGRAVRYVPASVGGYAWHLVWRRRLGLMQTAIQVVLHTGLRRGDSALVDPALAQLLGRAPRTVAAYARDTAAAFRV
jgi:uncharacterized protein YbjT (DUF2867 family)